MIDMAIRHHPVLVKETLEFLRVRRGGVYVDCTVGLGGHSEAIAEILDGEGRLVGLDRDGDALSLATDRLKGYSVVELYQDNFKNLPLVLKRLSIDRIDGCLIDLGVSSLQLDAAERGFSFREKGPLDLRMDQGQRTTAADLLNRLPEEALVDIFKRLGEEPSARRIAAEIVRRRRIAKITTTTELAELVEQVKGRQPGSRIHPATLVFQALRLEVNQELEGLSELLANVIRVLSAGGRLVVISFHSLEDRIVKQTFQVKAGKCICFKPADRCTCGRIQVVKILTKKPVTPSDEEVARNPRSRSAKLRAVEKLVEEEQPETASGSMQQGSQRS